MGLLTGKLIGSIVKRIGLGVADTIIPNVKANIESEAGGKGKIDYLRIAVSVSVLLLVIAVIFGAIDVEALKSVIKAIK